MFNTCNRLHKVKKGKKTRECMRVINSNEQLTQMSVRRNI